MADTRWPRWPTFLSLTGSFLALACVATAGCSDGGGVVPPEADGRAAAEPFLSEIREGRFDRAWDSTTAEFKSDMGREAFQRFVQERPALRQPLEFAGYEPDKTNGINRGACDFRAPASASPPAQVRILVARENGEWKVERLIVK